MPQQVIVSEGEQAPLLVRVARQLKILTSLEGMLLVVADAQQLVRLGPLRDKDSTEAWTKASGYIDEFTNRPFNVITLNPANAQLFLANHRRSVPALPLASSI